MTNAKMNATSGGSVIIISSAFFMSIGLALNTGIVIKHVTRIEYTNNIADAIKFFLGGNRMQQKYSKI